MQEWNIIGLPLSPSWEHNVSHKYAILISESYRALLIIIRVLPKIPALWAIQGSIHSDTLLLAHPFSFRIYLYIRSGQSANTHVREYEDVRSILFPTSEIFYGNCMIFNLDNYSAMPTNSHFLFVCFGLRLFTRHPSFIFFCHSTPWLRLLNQQSATFSHTHTHTSDKFRPISRDYNRISAQNYFNINMHNNIIYHCPSTSICIIYVTSFT